MALRGDRAGGVPRHQPSDHPQRAGARSEPPPARGRYGIEIVVTPDHPNYRNGAHGGQNVDQLLSTFKGTWGWTTKYKKTERNSSQMWARWDPQLVASGWYEVSAFVPSRHATTERARYKLHGVLGASGELEIPVRQIDYYNLWVPLGVFQFDATTTRRAFFLNDLTGEDNKEIAFDALRWRQVVGITPTNKYLADGYDAPIGTAAERASDDVWPGKVRRDRLRGAIGPGRRARRTTPARISTSTSRTADKLTPCTRQPGLVTYSTRSRVGHIIIIRHDPLITTGQVLYGRYAHVSSPIVKVGDRVVRGQQIAKVGNAEGLYAYHLTGLQPYGGPRDAAVALAETQLERADGELRRPADFIRRNRPEDR